MAQRVAGDALDLDDVGTPVGEHRAAARDEAELGELHHLDAVEHTHRVLLASGQPRSAAISEPLAWSSAPLISPETISPIASKPSPSVLPIWYRALMPSTMMASL